jgi:putative intracellular protease/amidase
MGHSPALAEFTKWLRLWMDTLVIPGGRGLRTTDINRAVAKWIRGRANTTRRIASVCTGIYGLAPTGRAS